jgi:hypothetical protein
VTFFYDKVYDVSKWEYVKFDETQNIYRTLASPAAVFGVASNGLNDVTTVKLTIVDGTEDDDNLNSGTVSDPSGPAVSSATLATTGNNNFAYILASIILVSISSLGYRLAKIRA